MSEIDNGGPAFPATVQSWNDRLSQYQDGMSLRDWFAGQVLSAVIAATAAGQHNPVPFYTGDKANLDAAIARDAYLIADAMLEARKVQP
jgi:hypothetical protein